MGPRHIACNVSLFWIIISLDYIASADRNYLGCYKDEGNPRSFVGHVEHFAIDLTPQTCTQLCYKKGFLFSATQGRTFCFCNDKHPNPNSKASEDRCSKPCSGNPAEKCGGETSLAVRKTGIPDYSETAQYVGCYYNPYGALNDVSLNYDKTNSPRRCMNVCFQLGYRYAGVQQSKECHCGNERPNAENNLNGDECKWPCPGDPNESCGGNGRIAIYTTTSTGNKDTEKRICEKKCPKMLNAPLFLEGSAPPRKKIFYVENTKKANWPEALMACARNGTRLATIDNVEELDEIIKIILNLGRRLGSYWTAGSDVGSEGNFIWATTGKPLSSTSDWWLIEAHHRQPDNYSGNENCVDLWERNESQGYGLNDRVCGIKCNYICESYNE